MSSTWVTVKELKRKLEKYPDEMKVATIWPGCNEDGEARVEGNLDGPDQMEVVRAYEVRSGWYYPVPEHTHELDCQEVLVLSDVGVQWLEVTARNENV